MRLQSDIDRSLSLYAEVLVRRIACRSLNINNSDRRNTYLIYGYNRFNRIFYLLGDTAGGYAPHEVRFDDYLKSISNRDDGMFNLNVMEYNPDFLFQFSRDQLISGLTNYIYSQDLSVFCDVTTPIYGLAAIEKLKDDVLADYGYGNIFSDKSFMVLFEHKKLMLIRLQYLKDNTDINAAPLIGAFNEIFDISKMILTKIDAFRVHRAPKTHSEIIDLLDELIAKDRIACNALLDVL